MSIDKDAIISRIEHMFWLEKDWDGFGTGPITRKAFDIATDLINFITWEDIEVKSFVGVKVEGSVYLEITRPENRRFEITIKPDGEIEYAELNSESCKIICRGSFLLNHDIINDVLK